MFRSFRLGTAFGIPLYIHFTFLLLPLLALAMAWPAGILAIAFSQVVLLSIFACVLLHELGHALMARVFSISTRDITLYPIGGVARLESTGDSPLAEVAIALAGPAVNFALALLLTPVVIFLALSGLALGPETAFRSVGLPGLVGSYLITLWLGNLVLLVFNLIPAFPMDGGRVLRALLSLMLGTLRATEVAAAIGLVLAVLLGIVGVIQSLPSLVLVAVFVAIAGQTELQMLRRRESRARLEVEPAVEILLPEQAPSRLRGFTGFVWDRDNRVWVRWIDGRPVSVP